MAYKYKNKERKKVVFSRLIIVHSKRTEAKLQKNKNIIIIYGCKGKKNHTIHIKINTNKTHIKHKQHETTESQREEKKNKSTNSR